MGGSMTFEKILSRLGERGELGETPRQMRQERSPSTGRMEANGEAKGEKFAQFAQRSPSRETAPDAEIRPIRPVRPGTEEIAYDLRLVSTWWAWSEQDLADFKIWARRNPDDAAQWIRQEAETVRLYVEQLRVASVTDFIRPTIDRSETEPPTLQSSVR
jgi:hypothetical protein